MGPYLELEIGDRHQVRGRAVICIEPTDVHHPMRSIYRLLDIDGASLKEAMRAEILGGRLISLDLFEPFYVKTSKMDSDSKYEELVELSHKDSRDFIYSRSSGLDNTTPEQRLEELVARYTTLYKEDTYLRVIHQIGDEQFHARKRTRAQFYYDPLLELAYWICVVTRARREATHLDLEQARESLSLLQSKLPVLDFRKIIQPLLAGNAAEWYELANYIDVFFVTLKKHFPLALGSGNYLEAKSEIVKWLKEELLSLWEEYFVALVNEEYEKAMELKVTIEDYSSFQSLEGRSNS